jgi:hypothetical protein
MANEPETPVANPPEAATPEPETGPSAAEVLQALQMERQRAAQFEQEANIARQQAQMAWTQRPSPPAPAEDPARGIFNDAITNPDAAADKFRQYVSQAAQDAVARDRQISDQRTVAMLAQQRDAIMLESAASRNPDLFAQDKLPQLAGEALRIKMEYEGKGLPQPPSVYLEKAVQALRARGNPQRGNSPAPAYVEGAGAGSLAGNPAQAIPSVPLLNPLEKAYGMPAGSITDVPMGDEIAEEATKFIEAENAEREKHQVMPAYSDIRIRA